MLLIEIGNLQSYSHNLPKSQVLKTFNT